jgi:hypothetical protein
MLVTRLRAFFPLSIFVLLTGALALGCGGATIEDVCNICSGDKKAVAACVIDGAEEQSRAEKAGCSSEFQALVDCARETATCSAGGHVEAKDCDAEEALVEKCSQR